MANRFVTTCSMAAGMLGLLFMLRCRRAAQQAKYNYKAENFIHRMVLKTVAQLLHLIAKAHICESTKKTN